MSTLEFKLAGTLGGRDISATKGLPYNKFIEFSQDVEKYLTGSDSKSVLRSVDVEIHEGSLKLRIVIPAGILASLISDTEKISTTKSLADVDPVRTKIVQKWQERARVEGTLSYEVATTDSNPAGFVVSSDTMFLPDEQPQLIDVERYIIGEIIEWGGLQNVNLHLRQRNTSKPIVIAAKPEQIRDEKENLVYHRVVVHVQAKENPRTGELDQYRLLDVRPYGPQVDEGALKALFAKGAAAWKDVGAAADWVKKLRSNENG
ncbi:hypothetical protein ESB00_01045 [Oleiharenicola lentus]|uniref:Uncharacterized protein n=1 Tax=Oleiharenicola lentus TaxID=2508720 RepID=A0A4Q1C6U5_9BACT|nr:hypothetical protein [Oleiharenicola lentus]RXK54516.1 hypothetical protein ESB00_01045 [Oleiharenicola lentus]